MLKATLQHKLSLLLKFDLKIASETDPDCLLKLLAEETRQILQADRCTVFLVRRKTGELWSKIAQGMRSKTILLKKGQGLAGKVLETRKAIHVRDAYNDKRFSRHVDMLTGYRTRSILAMPMWDSRKRNVLGVFQVLNKKSGEFTVEDEQLLTVLADHAAVAVENAQLYDDLRNAHEETIFRLALMAEHRDQHDTAAHLRRVSAYTGIVAEALGMDAEQVATLRLASTLHDIGKVATPDAVLMKTEKLSPTEIGQVEYRLAWWMEKLKFQNAPAERLKEIAQYLEDIQQANRPSSREMPEPLVQRIRFIASQKFIDRDGIEKPMLTEGEIKKLTIRRGNLTEEEWEQIRRHTLDGAKILGKAESSLMQLAEKISLTHHEKYDGTGYPKGLKGERIPLEGRIVGLVDVFDALSSRRVYKEQWDLGEVIDHIKQQSGKHFDPKVVAAFLKNLPKIRKSGGV